MSENKGEGNPTRREFLGGLVSMTSGIALAGALQRAAAESQPAIPTCPSNTTPPDGVPQANGELLSIAEIRSGPDKVLRATLTVSDENRALWIGQPNTADKDGFPATICRQNERMRFFSGSPAGGKQVWPIAKGVPGPGPTMRARVGDSVQITLLNQVDVKNFPDTLDLAEQGKSAGCDISATLVGPPGNQARQQVYPNGDQEPDCFHGSSTANLHFHGFHVNPNTVGDNVLVQVRPSPRDPRTNHPVVTEASVRQSFQEIFAAASNGRVPQKWTDLPKTYRDAQEQLLRAYDKQITTAKLWPANETAIKAGEWPEYYIGAYANCFKITEYGTPIGPGMPAAKAGQCPGTHWYHAHKHGSVSLNIFNGMAGAFIVEGDYDDRLKAFYTGQGLEEKVLVIQQYASTLNLLTTPGPNPPPQPTSPPPGTQLGPACFVNGQPKPLLTMRPGQVQLWRMLNACAQTAIQFASIDPVDRQDGGKPAFQWRQTAQDGIQFHWNNFSKAANRNPVFTMAPANRVDLLVQAPSAPGVYEVRINQFPFPGASARTTLMSIAVRGEPMTARPGFPQSPADFPPFPEFLRDIEPAEIHLRRDVTFDTEAFNANGERTPGFARGGFPRLAASKHTIDGLQFQNNVINKVMLLDTSEEWTLINTTQVLTVPLPPKKEPAPLIPFGHPFHIHVNPFQVVEIFDPVTMEKPQVFEKDFIWYDTIAIPPAYNFLPDAKTPRLDKNGKQVFVPGYVKIRSRFLDFTGMFVLHCHILGHEDRGMMQLVEVVSNKTLMEHYH